MLTKLQARVLRFIEEWQFENRGRSPSLEEIRAGVALSSKGAVHRVLTDLQARGHIFRPGSQIGRAHDREIWVTKSLRKPIPIFRSGDHKIMGYVS